MNNLEIIQSGYQAFSEGNIEAVLALFDKKIEWNECKGFPFIKGDGLSIGPVAVVQDVLRSIVTWRMPQIQASQPYEL